MLRLAALTVIAVVLASSADAVEGVETPESPCNGYLTARERLAPREAFTREDLQEIIGRGDAETVELVGDISGRASSSDTISAGLSRMLMMTLDDGSHITLRAGEEIDRIRVGERIAVIASVGCATRVGEFVLEAWIHEWDLPPVEAGEALEQREEPEEIIEIFDGAGESGPEQEPSLIEPRDLPRSAATMAFRVDAVRTWKAWVLEHNSRLTDQQAEDIVTWVLYYSQQHNVNHKLIFSLIKWESWFKPENISHAGAIGLMQVMPGTARGLGIDPYNVQQNIEGGIRYLSNQLAKYPDRSNRERVILALACYNAGPNAVKRAGHRVPNIRETRNYVRKVTETFQELHESGMP